MNKLLKYSLLLLFVFVAEILSAQLLLPKFEAPKPMDMVNTNDEEIAPVPFLNGEKLYFVRAKPNGKAKERMLGQEIWSIERNGDSWSEPKSIFSAANDLGNNGVIGSSFDGNKVYVFNSIQSRRKLARGIAYVEKQDDGSWGDLKRLQIDGFEIGEGYYSFYVNQNEDVLLISMAPDNSTINEDLFVSTKDSSGKWSEVQSLGAKINTKGVELSPFITEDKTALYFASNGHGGEGGVDIFVSYRLGEGWKDWTAPVNLGAEINSPFFDGYFMIGNNREVFFVSDRDSAMGDIYTTMIVENNSVKLATNQVNGQFLYKGLPGENVSLEVYDEFGNIVDTVVTDQFGMFTYNKLNIDDVYLLKLAAEDVDDHPDAVFYELDENGKKANKYSLTKTGHFVNAEEDGSVTGTYLYNKLPLDNAYLLVYDEEGVVVDTIMTDAEGSFVYKKLNVNATYTFKPLDISKTDDVFVDITDPAMNVKGNFSYKSLPLQNEALLVLDENGGVVDTIYTDAQGNFNYTKLSADNKYSFKPLELKDEEQAFDFTVEEPDETVVEGTMKYKKLPLINSPLLVKDENGMVVDTIYTDLDGKFRFKKLKTDGSYTFEAFNKEEDPELLDFVFAEVEKEQVQGSFVYQNLPLQNEALVVLDANGFPVDTIYTDESGRFMYKKLKGETNYTLKLLNDNDLIADDLVLVLDEEKEEIAQETPEVVVTPKKKLTPKGTNIVAKQTIYFNFNEFTLSQDDYVELDKVIANKSKIKEIVLEGHTDSIGSVKNNLKVASLRVDSAANYLVKNGIEPKIIKRVPVGEEQPVADNSTVSGRSKNRRVTIICN